jgi:hypothetical protein
MSTPRYEYIAVEDGSRDLAHIFVAPQEFPGLDIGYINPVKSARGMTIGGDIYIGNAQDGYYTIDFEMTIRDGVDGAFEFGDDDYDLTKGRCFLVKEGYEIVQLPCQSKEEAVRLLGKGNTEAGDGRE